jgi:hypothetical protein
MPEYRRFAPRSGLHVFQLAAKAGGKYEENPAVKIVNSVACLDAIAHRDQTLECLPVTRVFVSAGSGMPRPRKPTRMKPVIRLRIPDDLPTESNGTDLSRCGRNPCRPFMSGKHQNTRGRTVACRVEALRCKCPCPHNFL